MNYWNPMTEQVEQTDDYCPVCGWPVNECNCGEYEINKNQAEYLD